MKINWKVRLRHKPFLVALFALSLLLVQQVAAIFGIDTSVYNEQVTDLFNTVLSILVLVGVVVDPTTSGTADSQQALGYDKPRVGEDFKMITISPVNFDLNTGAKGSIDDGIEASKVTSTITALLRAVGIDARSVKDKQARSKSATMNDLIAEQIKPSEQLDVSIHFNKVRERTDRTMGVEVLYLSDTTKLFAERVAKSISKASGLKNCGAVKRTDLGVLCGTNNPCILIEVCFVENTADATVNKENYDKICKAIAKELATLFGKSIITSRFIERIKSVVNR